MTDFGRFLSEHIPADGAWRMVALTKEKGSDAPVELTAYRLDGQGRTVRATYPQPVDNPVNTEVAADASAKA